jgi:DNA polymerase III delta prime subunit
MSSVQLWQQMKLTGLDDMVGNEAALEELKKTPNGLILLEGPMGCGKTSLALALCKERTGIQLEENRCVDNLGRIYAQHCHAMDFNLGDALEPRHFFYYRYPVFIIVDEAQELTDKRQQSRIKTMPAREELTIVFCTTNPERLDDAVIDRCTKVRLKPMDARQVPGMVKKACAHVGIPYNVDIVKACNAGGIFRPRAIIQAVQAVAAGKSIVEAVSGQKK